MSNSPEVFGGPDLYLARGDFVHRDVMAMEVVRCEGCCLYTRDGEPWIDLGASNGAALFGYDGDLVRRIANKSATIPFCSPSYETTHRRTYASKLGDRISRHQGVRGKLAFSVGGAGGIELALRVAAANRPSRRTVFVLQGCYHGRSLFLSHLSSSLRYRASGSTPGYNVIRLPVPHFIAQHTGGSLSEAVKFCIAHMQAAFRNETAGAFSTSGGSDALAVIFEPILNVAGMVDPALDFIDALLREAALNQCISIADEVFTGCFRTGAFLGSDRFHLRPDILVLSKALTNGLYPLSAVWANDPLFDQKHFPPGSYSSTHCNAPAHFIAGDEVFTLLSSIESDSIIRITEFLKRFCTNLAQWSPVRIVDFNVIGMTAYVEFETRSNRDAFLARMASSTGGANTRLLFSNTSLSPTRILLHPPLTLLDADIENVFRSLKARWC